MKNWFGATSHPTDQYITWRDKDASSKAVELRNAYDLLVKDSMENVNALNILLEAAYDSGREQEAELNAGEDI